MVIEKEYNCFIELLNDIQKSCKGEIMPCDKSPNYGWCDVENETIYKISMMNVSKSLNNFYVSEMIKNHFLNRKKQNLRQLLNLLPDLEKLLSMKAFW